MLTVVGIAARRHASRCSEHDLVSDLLYGVSAMDPLTFVVIPVVLFMVAALAIYIPARRASRVDPVVALRMCNVKSHGDTETRNEDLPRSCVRDPPLSLCVSVSLLSSTGKIPSSIYERATL